MDDRVTTVAFVTYRFATGIRRVGPLPLEAAETCAKEFSRKKDIQDVRLEEWACVSIKDVK